jgi:type VI secretion system secreted protein Hcp
MPQPSYAYFDGIDGSVEDAGREKSVMVLELDHIVEVPVDVKDASATGTRRHGSMKLVCNIDKATPRLMECVCFSKTIPKVKVEYWRTNNDGKQENYYNINLEAVRIVKAEHWFPNVDDAATTTYKDMMTYELRYDKIEWIYTDGNLSFADQWKKPNV